MSQINRVENYLYRHGQSGRGFTASKIASDTKVPRESVLKRISDLRTEGARIYTNTRMVNGQRRYFYRFDEARSYS